MFILSFKKTKKKTFAYTLSIDFLLCHSLSLVRFCVSEQLVDSWLQANFFLVHWVLESCTVSHFLIVLLNNGVLIADYFISNIIPRQIFKTTLILNILYFTLTRLIINTFDYFWALVFSQHTITSIFFGQRFSFSRQKGWFFALSTSMKEFDKNLPLLSSFFALERTLWFLTIVYPNSI